jgi:uncharacterized membrane protein
MDLLQVHRRARNAGFLLGLGLGGFMDGILLHQILQWHNMLSSRVPPMSMEAMRSNMSADGWFQVGVWLLTLAGVLLLWSAARHPVSLPPLRYFVGLLFGGWGVFNLVEGTIDHHLLELHHVRDVPVHVPAYDYIFLLVGGLGFVVLGWLLSRGVSRGQAA